MKKLRTIFRLIVIIGFPLFGISQNRWITDTEMHFKIQAPRNYKQNQFIEGTDKILALVSPDDNVAVRVRAMKSSNQVTKELLQQVFEQNIISGAKRIMNEAGDLHGIPATATAYTWKYNNIETVIGAYYIIQNGFAYIVWSIVPQNLLTRRSAEADAIIDSFELLKPSDTFAGTEHSTNQNTVYSNHSDAVFLLSSVMGSGVDNQLNISNPASQFPTNTQQIAIGFSYSGNASKSPFLLKWHSKTHNVLVREVTLNAPHFNTGKGYSFISNQGKAWPEGDYFVEVWHNGKNLGLQNFQIQ